MDFSSDDEDTKQLFEVLNAALNEIREDEIMDSESDENDERSTMEMADFMDEDFSTYPYTHVKEDEVAKFLADSSLDEIVEVTSSDPHTLTPLGSVGDRRGSDFNNNVQPNRTIHRCQSPNPRPRVNSRWPTAEERALRNRRREIDEEIEEHRSESAAVMWKGRLPPKEHQWPTYSPKVFVGGIPFGITQDELCEEFSKFGDVEIVWPKTRRMGCRHGTKVAGHVYVIFEDQKQVKSLIKVCANNAEDDAYWHYEISSGRWASKKVQVVPWLVFDDHWAVQRSSAPDTRESVFVGGLHGLINAHALVTIMQDLFGGVVAAELDTDAHQYPTGSGRVTFSDHASYMRAATTAFFWMETPDFIKKAQVEPYFEKSTCTSCRFYEGIIFCKDVTCFRYFCEGCWGWYHQPEARKGHEQLKLRK